MERTQEDRNRRSLRNVVMLEKNRSRIPARQSRPVSYRVSITSVYAAIYVALTFVFASISYGQVNLRLANALLGLVPIIGWPAVIGQTLGVLITASVSPLGPIDLVNIFPAFFFSWLIWRLRNVSVIIGLTCYSIGLGLSVSMTLGFVTGASFLVLFPYVTGGILITTAGLGYGCYRSVKRSHLLDKHCF